MEEAGWINVLKAAGGYGTSATLVVMGLFAWWHVLPKLIDAISNRQSKIEERMALLLETTTARFEGQLAAADKRHEDCMKGQQLLIQRIDDQDKKLSEQSTTISEQSDLINGLKAQLRQLQMSAVRLDGTPISQMARGVVVALDNLELDQATAPEQLKEGNQR